MRLADTLAALEVWLDASLLGDDWTGPLTWSLKAAGARAMALASKDLSGSARVEGASVGASADFLNLCRDICSGPCAFGVQDRYVAGIGRLAWAGAPVRGGAIVLFAVFDDDAELEILGQLGLIAGKCVAARLIMEADRSASSLKSGALEKLPIGVVIADSEGQCVETNDTAREILARADGLLLRSGRLFCHALQDQRAVMAALNTDLERGRDVFVRISRKHGATPYVVRAMTTKAPTGRVSSVLMIVDPDIPPAAAPEIWRAMFNLTDCELLVAQTIVSGGSVMDLARRRGVAVGTVRQQAKSLMKRLDVSSQAAAAAILSRVAPFAPALGTRSLAPIFANP